MRLHPLRVAHGDQVEVGATATRSVLGGQGTEPGLVVDVGDLS